MASKPLLSTLSYPSYTSYRGTALPGGVTQWVEMRFAAAPIGDLRFAAPVDPVVNATIQMADEVCNVPAVSVPMCIY